MTLSKAICISRRKISLFAILLLILLPLSAGELRVAVIGEDEGYNQLAHDVLELLSGSVDSEVGKELYLRRAERRAEDEYERKVLRYLENEDFEALGKLERERLYDDEITLSVVSPRFSSEELPFLLKGDREATRYLMERENVDLLVVFSVVSEEPLTHIVTYLNGEKARESLYSESLREVELEALIDLFFDYLKDEDTRLLRIELPERATLYIDGEQEPLYTGYAALKDGKHTFSYTAPGYLPKTVSVVVGEGFSSIDLALERVLPMPIYFDALPYDVDLSYNGEKVEEGYVEDGIYPFTVTASSPGFDTYSYQTTKRALSLDIELKPQWMADSDILSQAKGDFYQSLFYTLMTFGAQIGLNTLSGLYPDTSLKPVSVVFKGISLVSLINTLDSAFEYYQAAKLGL